MINCSVAFNVNALRVGTDSVCVRQLRRSEARDSVAYE